MYAINIKKNNNQFILFKKQQIIIFWYKENHILLGKSKKLKFIKNFMSQKLLNFSEILLTEKRIEKWKYLLRIFNFNR